jgi:hypothetical protein
MFRERERENQVKVNTKLRFTAMRIHTYIHTYIPGMPTVEESDEEGRRVGHRDIGGEALRCCKGIMALPLLDLIIITAAAPD